MNYRIEKHKAFKVIGIKETVSTKDGENMRIIPKLWQTVPATPQYKEMLKLKNDQPDGVLGICTNFDEDNNTMDYYIAVPSTSVVPDGLNSLELPETSWAIFESIGAMPEAIQTVWKEVLTNWLPKANYEHTMGAELEVYYDGDTMAPDYKCEVWIPVVKK